MTMKEECLQLEKRDQWVIVRLDHPPVNSLHLALMDQLNEKLIQLEGEEKIKVIIITGSGKFFAAGGDIEELQKVDTFSEGLQLSHRIHSVFNRVETFSKPIVAAVNGACFGGGLELALACHMRVADEEAKFGFPEINLGLIPGGGGTQRLPRVVGRAKAYEMILSGDPVDAKEAHRMGLVNLVTPRGECMAYAERYAEKISQKASPAIEAAVKSIQASKGDDGERGFQKEAELFGHLFETPKTKEGIKAFLEKRKPKFDR